jgi:hypothetical protein
MDYLALIALVIALSTMFVVLWQAILMRKAFQMEAFISLRDMAIRKNYNEGIALIETMEDLKDYESFTKHYSKEEQEKIYNCIEFLNFTAHLVESDFIKRQQVWDMYFMAYRISAKKLLPWWLVEQRKNHHSRLMAFERMCVLVNGISEEKILAFEKKAQIKLEKLKNKL